MMDIQEAIASFDFYCGTIDLHCKKYEMAMNLVAAEEAWKKQADPAQALEDGIEDTARRVAQLVEESAANLERVCREALALSNVISDAVKVEIERLACQPGELAKLIDAQNRNISAAQKAGLLLQGHKKRAAATRAKAELDALGEQPRWRRKIVTEAKRDSPP